MRGLRLIVAFCKVLKYWQHISAILNTIFTKSKSKIFQFQNKSGQILRHKYANYNLINGKIDQKLKQDMAELFRYKKQLELYESHFVYNLRSTHYIMLETTT